MGTRRLRDPHYGMVVTDATGTFMLISRRTPVGARGDEHFVWYALRLDDESVFAQYVLLLDPDQFGEVA
jgi:hypothetical protein